MHQQEIREIVKRMTLEEKASLCSGKDFWHLEGFERLGVPSVMVSDGPHGLRKQDEKADHLGVNESIKAVCFPAGCATACSFDEELPERLGRTLGQECRAENVSVLLGPAINMKRSPLCGRNFEYYSEDPYLVAKQAGAMVRGIQSQHIAATVKHFALNNKETNRKDSNSRVSERAARQIYLKTFERIVKEAKPWCIMSSYNIVNDYRASENHDLLEKLLRDEWGFEGVVMTDWWTFGEHCKEVNAGNDVKMAAGNPDNLLKALEKGLLKRETMECSVKRLLGVLLKID